MDALYARDGGTVADVLEDLPDPPSYSAVRAMLAKLERKGHIRHEEQGAKYVYVPIVPREAVRENALERVVKTFFDGSPTRAMAALLDMDSLEMSDDEIDELAKLVNDAKNRGR